MKPTSRRWRMVVSGTLPADTPTPKMAEFAEKVCAYMDGHTEGRDIGCELGSMVISFETLNEEVDRHDG